MERKTHQEILDELHRIANGDTTNDLETLAAVLPRLTSEVLLALEAKG